jgi:hypothetical protein
MCTAILFVRNGEKANARRGIQIQCVHIGGPDDARHKSDAFDAKSLDEGFAGRHTRRAADLRVGVRCAVRFRF